MIIKVEDGGFVKLDNFKNLLDISKVVYYKLQVQKDKSITVKFYDKDKKLINPKTLKYYQLIFYSSDLIFNPLIRKFDTLQDLYQELEDCKRYKQHSYYIQEVSQIDFISQTISHKND